MKKTFVRLLSVVLAALLLLCIAGCEGGSASSLSGAQSETPAASAPAAGGGAQTPEAAPSPEPEPEPAQPQKPAETPPPEPEPTPEPTPEAEALLAEDGVYTTKEDVARYLYQYGRLPDNFITKKEAQSLGWNGGSLEPYAPGMCIGGDRFGNYEGLLPEKPGRTYRECDIDTLGARSRGAKRIVYSNDGLIYYTDDHYESFALVYGEE